MSVGCGAKVTRSIEDLLHTNEAVLWIDRPHSADKMIDGWIVVSSCSDGPWFSAALLIGDDRLGGLISAQRKLETSR
jgi:hypothetical protein